ncbi:long-chain-fatty-acid--CoA ligase ACSBG1 [Eurytemora carolleeae]|uniref:long-chain-fatty-acid--CoA ligase ACSBG1 n=1 Tax=Eurytemora carolleeae TaxID=1294199 RepID=UPI000C789E48|nr:long-chain-fatty-acid--CoA ligase ACSBG1 [Eurytemora carolleeae]|eukprot:XP_023330631.1 long-chain-fatty-acid--CoA ligase ACSBG1-like [Eurytemora affinis]
MEDSCAVETKGAVLGYGRNIFMGYLNKENENQSKLTDDYWLKLGDQGALDDEGFLLVYGQVQDQIVMASGEVVNPSNIEGNLRLELPCISSCIVVGHGTDRLGALLSLDTVTDENGSPSNILTPQTVNWFRDARFDVKTIKDVVDNLDSGLKHVIQAGIDRANQLVITSCRMIVEWRVLPISFSVGTGELGPTLIIRRSLIQDKFSVHIQQLLTQEETRKHSFTDSIGGDSTATASEQPEAGHPYPHHLHQIIEEEERSNRNSVDKDMDQIGNTENVNNNNGEEIKETKEEKNEEKLIEDETKSEEEEVEKDEKKKNSEASEEDDEDLTGEDSGKKFEERRISENMALQDKMSIKKKISRKYRINLFNTFIY